IHVQVIAAGDMERGPGEGVFDHIALCLEPLAALALKSRFHGPIPPIPFRTARIPALQFPQPILVHLDILRDDLILKWLLARAAQKETLPRREEFVIEKTRGAG